MKFLAIIFSIIVTTLTIVPCCAYDNCEKESVQDESTNKSEIPCSPFVHCSCSTGIQITPSVALDFFRETQIVKQETQYMQFFTSSYFSSIWQPPRNVC